LVHWPLMGGLLH